MVSRPDGRSLGVVVLRGAAVGGATQTLAEKVPDALPALQDLFSDARLQRGAPGLGLPLDRKSVV